MDNKVPLKTLEELEAFDGEKSEVTMPAKKPLESIPWSQDEIIEHTSTMMRMKSGRGWQGANITQLYESLKKLVKADHTA